MLIGIVQAIDVKDTEDRSFDIGGPDILTYVRLVYISFANMMGAMEK